ncbi:Vacuolar-sorting receptor 7 [Linum perenne]
MVGSVIYPQKGSLGCKPFDGETPFMKLNPSRPIILLLDRGDYYFALKVWNAQQAGAAAVLVMDTVDEPLITMDSPEASSDADGYIDKIGIPSALIDKLFSDSLKEALKEGKEEVVVKLDWRESMPHPDQRVEYELWTNSNDECGIRCDEQMDFRFHIWGRIPKLHPSRRSNVGSAPPGRRLHLPCLLWVTISPGGGGKAAARCQWWRL